MPTALPGIISGILLALARVIGETTSRCWCWSATPGRSSMNVFEGNMASLPLLIYTELINPEEAGRMRVWGAALTLILLVAAMYVGGGVRQPVPDPKPSLRQ